MTDFLAPNQVHKVASASTLGDTDDDRLFDTPEAETAYHKERYKLILEMLNDTRAELDDFQFSSKELEDELERELAQTDKQQAELRHKVLRLEGERDELKSKILSLQKSHNAAVGNMQIDNLRSERDKVRIAMRDLEMGNDDLERQERVAVSSLLDLESKYNRAIEERTLLEQEVVLKAELEEESQRLKDELRDANSEIGILRDQLSRTAHRAEAQHQQEHSYVEVSIANATMGTPPAPSALPRSLANGGVSGMSRSNSSPQLQRALNRSTTSRNLAMAAGSPLPIRVRQQTQTGLPMSPSRSSHLNASTLTAPVQQKSKGVQMVSDLRARIRAMDSKLAPKGKRAVSAPMPAAVTSGTQSRLKALTATPGDGSNASIMSPNGWILVSDQDDTPTPASNALNLPDEPKSPTRRHFRAPSSNGTTSSKPLPSRPGIPSPLAHSLNKSTASSVRRPPSRAGTSTSSHSRPMSPSLLPVPGRMQSPSPAFGMSSIAFPSDRPPSRLLGRGHPPVSGRSLTPTPAQAPDTPLRRTSRRSSIGLQPHLPPTGIPAPSPGRPLSVPMQSAIPPPVPRIPSAHLKKSAAAAAASALGVSRRRPSVSDLRSRMKS